MRYTKILGLAVVVGAALMAFAASASATTVTTTTGGAAATPTIHAVNEGGHVSLANPNANIECSATLEPAVESHGTGTTVKGRFIRFDFLGCTGWTYVVISTGTFSLHWTSGHNGTLTLSTARIRLILHTVFGDIECEYGGEETLLGTVTGGNPATIHLEGKLPFAGGSALCGSGSSQLGGKLVTTSALYVTP